MSTNHKDGSDGVWGCEAFDSRRECPQCARYDALVSVKHAKQGDFGPVACDGGDWLIPASGLKSYLERFAVNNVNGNVKVTGKKTAVMVEFAAEKAPKDRARAGVAAGPVHGPTDKSRLELDAHASSAEVVRSSRIANDVACQPVVCLE